MFHKKHRLHLAIEFARDKKNTSRDPENPINLQILDEKKKTRKTTCILRLIAPGGMSKKHCMIRG